jgi:hypothetical protein
MRTELENLRLGVFGSRVTSGTGEDLLTIDIQEGYQYNEIPWNRLKYK